MKNSQLPEKQSGATSYLEVHSIFLTIQGEGPFSGRRAVFVRLAGCNLQCPMCDTDYTSNRQIMAAEHIEDQVSKFLPRHESNLVVITGGEPFRQHLATLVSVLLGTGYDVQIETNGTLYQDLPYPRITVVCSPKTGSINKKLLPHISALKYVLSADSKGEDGLPLEALGHTASPHLARPPANFKGKIYLQPIDESSDPKIIQRHYDAVTDSVLTHNFYLCLQTHKIIGVE